MRPSATLRIWLVLPSEDRRTRDAANFLHGTANQRYAVLTPHSSPCHWVTIPFSVDLLTPPHSVPLRPGVSTRPELINAMRCSPPKFCFHLCCCRSKNLGHIHHMHGEICTTPSPSIFSSTNGPSFQNIVHREDTRLI